VDGEPDGDYEPREGFPVPPPANPPVVPVLVPQAVSAVARTASAAARLVVPLVAAAASRSPLLSEWRQGWEGVSVDHMNGGLPPPTCGR